MSSSMCNFTFIDLFAGIGGFRVALESYGGRCVFSSDINKVARFVYNENFNEIPKGDITLIDEKLIPSHDILCGGFPCQAFSISGKQRGFEDIRGTLFFDIARIIKHHKPKVLFLENVKNFERHNNGKTLEVIKTILIDLGYNVFCKVLNASHYGVPTSRERLYFVCFRKDLKIENFTFPSVTNENKILRDIVDTEGDFSKYIINRSDIILNNKIVESDLFGSYPSKPIRIGTINKGGQGERIYSDLGHAITFSAYGGGIASKTGAYLINGRIRKLTPKECLKIMGFPENFKLQVSDSQAYKLIGNSVTVTVLKKIFEHIVINLNE